MALVVRSPYTAFAGLLAQLHPQALRPRAILAEDQISERATIHATAWLGSDVVIGVNTSIGPHASITDAIIGNEVIIHRGVQIGQDGFGFAPTERGHVKVVQLGKVVIGDNVEIGANTTIDSGSSRDTVIGAGTKIDNLVQIAHNVEIGCHCLITAQASIAGSTTIEDFVAIGGQAATAGHLRIGKAARLAAASGVMRDVPAGQGWGGSPRARSGLSSGNRPRSRRSQSGRRAYECFTYAVANLSAGLSIRAHAGVRAVSHAKQFKRHHRQLRLLKSRLGRVIRDIRRKIEGRPELEAIFEAPLARAAQIRSQQQRQRGWKLYSFHTPEVECIGKGKASAPYEFGVKVSIVTTNGRAPGGLFVLHAKALPGNPYDGHPLGGIIEATEKLTGCAIERAYVDKSYRGHKAERPRRVFISGQKRGVFGFIQRELRRRSAIEPIIGHMKSDGHLGRCHLKGREGDAINVILTAIGHNLRRVLAWMRILLTSILVALWPQTALKPAS
jgi:IS5 family transposase